MKSDWLAPSVFAGWPIRTCCSCLGRPTRYYVTTEIRNIRVIGCASEA